MIIKILNEGSKTNLEVKENKDKSVYVKGAKEVHINNPSEVFKVIDEGQPTGMLLQQVFIHTVRPAVSNK